MQDFWTVRMSGRTGFPLGLPRLLATLAFALSFAAAGLAQAATSLIPAYPGAVIQGPAKARGVVVYSHGRSLVGEDADSPAPAYLKGMAKAGWDVLRFNRPSAEDTLPASSRDLTQRAVALKAQGYKRVILSGQSFGGFLSIMAAAKTDAVDGVIATSPAAFGSFSDSYDTWKMNASELYRHLAKLHHTHLLLAFFHGDEYDPGGRGERSVALLSNSDVFAVVLDQPHDLVGHLAAAGSQFARRFGDCLDRFADGTDLKGACEDATILTPSPNRLPQVAGGPLDGPAPQAHAEMRPEPVAAGQSQPRQSSITQ